ncbi:molybdate ABC transporter substrate-binding protein [Nodosilinea sp. LEGE 07088]|uniref:molybdate ABC transporter substrate-binding protein n=1 Tax=Nodosilinea sp. LEGE 07088 TaxID=2777968 RepID=UPI00187E9B96|nr:molybdate ABC transporter substrate-binding protein [Nodosilinea sp. LEGE 07088]MBE9138675.1 molybdate ABC transporter substrate-binding protein [Nodosilinea sp. LEGE 07088]
MNRRQVLTWGGLALAAGLGAIACGGPTPVSPDSTAGAVSGDPVGLTVSAAASVQDALAEVQEAYGEVAPNVTITYNFGSSGSLAQQIAQGAPSDVFLSAAPKWMDDLEAKGQLLEGSRRDLLRNAMVLIVPKDKTTVADFTDLDRVEKVAIGEPESVPAGQYAKDVLTTLNLYTALQPKLVFGKDVRQVLGYVATGNVDAGLVYATDALESEQVQVVATAPEDSHAPIIYPVAVVRDIEHTAAAQAFVDFLSSDRAIAIFRDHGFGMAE